MTMTLIETKVLGTAAASIEFTSIPQDGTDLVFLLSLRGSNSATRLGVTITVNSNTGSIYTYRELDGADGGVSSYGVTGTPAQTPTMQISSNTSTSNTFSNNILYFTNYAGSTAKSFSMDDAGENNSTTAYIMGIAAGLVNLTAAITSVAFGAQGHNFAIGSTISLYKITRGTSNGVVVS